MSEKFFEGTVIANYTVRIGVVATNKKKAKEIITRLIESYLPTLEFEKDDCLSHIALEFDETFDKPEITEIE